MSRLATRTVSGNTGVRSFTLEGYDSDPYFAHIEDAFSDLANLGKLVKELCPRDGTVLDVGANMGVSALVMGEANPGVRIHAIEPVPATFHLLRENLTRNSVGNVSAHQLAISDRIGEVAFHSSGNSSANHIVNEAHIASEHFANLESKVRCTTLDMFVREKAISRVDFVKIDVEGFEIDVLNGMTDIIDKFNPIVSMEFNTWTMIAFRNINPRDLLSRFFGLLPVVYQYKKNNPYRRLVTQEDKMSFLRENMFDNGFVDDLVGCRDPARLAALG